MPWVDIPIDGGWDAENLHPFYANLHGCTRSIPNGKAAKIEGFIREGSSYRPMAPTAVSSPIDSTAGRLFYPKTIYKAMQNNSGAILLTGTSNGLWRWVSALNSFVDLTGNASPMPYPATAWNFVEYGDWLIANGYSNPVAANGGVFYPKILKDRNTYAVTALTWAAGKATATTSATHGLNVNDYISVAGATQAGYNLANVQITDVVSTTQFKYAVVSDPGAMTGTPMMFKCFEFLKGYGNNYANAMCFNAGHLILGDLYYGGTACPKRLAWSGIERIEEWPPNLSPIIQPALSVSTTDNKTIAASQFSYKNGADVLLKDVTASLALAAGTSIAKGSLTLTTAIPLWGVWRVSINAAGAFSVLSPVAIMKFGDEAAAIGALKNYEATPSLKTTVLPAGNTPIGYVTVKAKDATSTFTVGTDSLKGGGTGNVAAETNFYIDAPSLLDGLGLNESDYQDMGDIKGPIIQMVNAGPFFYIIGRDSISTGRYVGYPYIYEFKSNNVCSDLPIMPNSFIMVNQIGYFLGLDGIYAVSGPSRATKLCQINVNFTANATALAPVVYDYRTGSIIWNPGTGYFPMAYHIQSNSLSLLTTVTGTDADQPMIIGGYDNWPETGPYLYGFTSDYVGDGLFYRLMRMTTGWGANSRIVTRTLFSDKNAVLTIKGIKVIGTDIPAASKMTVTVDTNPVANPGATLVIATYNAGLDVWDVRASGRELAVIITNTQLDASNGLINLIQADIDETAAR